jgi:hypothetical protein
MMTWYDQFLTRRCGQVQFASERLIQLGRRRFDAILYPAELQVLNDTACSLDLPSPEEGAPRPEPSYDETTPRPEVRAAFLCWLATDLEARPYIHAKGLRVYSSTITGNLDLGGHLQLPTLDFRRCRIRGRIILESSETKGIHITDCSMSKGLEADCLMVHGPVFLHRTQSEEEIRFINATIKNNLECQGAKLTAEGDALSLDGATIEGNLFFENGFECRGEVRMLGAQIDGSVSFSGAKLMGKKDALTLDKVHIGRNLLLNRKLQCTGTIRLPNCRIEGDLNFMGAEVCAVRCYNMNLSGDLMWHGVKKTLMTHLDLRRAQLKTLHDDEGSWPRDGELKLDNLVYDNLTLHDTPSEEQLDQGTRAAELLLEVDQRIAWLKLQPAASRLQPQPWLQLSRYLASTNDKTGAKRVLYKFRWLQAQESWWLKRRARIAFAWLEQAPVRIMYPILVTLLLGTLIFVGASPDISGAMIPTARDKDGQPVAGMALARYPPFQPLIYTVENAVPLVKLGIDDKWTPDPAHRGKALFPQYSWLNWLRWFNSYAFLTASRWLIILLGWFQAAVLGAAITSRFKP